MLARLSVFTGAGGARQAARLAAARRWPRGCGGAVHGLGDLESAVMDVLWRAEEPVRVREVMQRLDTGRTLAYTTVMTVLDNLHRKSWVRRELAGKAYLYTSSLSREEAAARALRNVIDASGDPEAVLLHFARSVSEHESSLLRKGLRKRPGGR